MKLDSKLFKSICTSRPNAVLVNGDINHAIKRWKETNKNNGVTDELFERKFYQKPSDKRRKQIEIARYNATKEL